MFHKLSSTQYPPKSKPLMVYDGNCGFCKYWILKWKRATGNAVEYKPYQEVATQFKDISTHHFQEAVRFIQTDGIIVNGPDAAYITYKDDMKFGFLHRWYRNKKWFTKLSDIAYQWIADNRTFMYKLSLRLYGKNPLKPKKYWLNYLLAIILFLISLIYLL